MAEHNNKQENNHAVVEVSRAEIFSGPLPHPDVLHKFNLVVPGAADRIITMAENQSLHRIEMEKKVITSDIKNSQRGQIFGFVIAIFGLSLSFVLIVKGLQIVGTILGGVTLLSLVSVFVYGSKTRKDERMQKEERMQNLGLNKEN